MPNTETMQEYLVKIGWDVNTTSFNSASSLLEKFKGKLTKIAGSTGTAFFLAASLAVTVLKEVNEYTWNLLETQAKLDLSYETLARKYYTTEERVRSYKTAIEALAIDESDLLYLTDEQYNRLIELNRFGQSLEAPAGLDDTLKVVREIGYQFSKLKVVVSYGTRWISYYLGQYIGKDLTSIRDKLQKAVTWIADNISPIAKEVAKFLNIFWRLGRALIAVLSMVIELISNIAKTTIGKAAIVAAAIAGIASIIMSGPIGYILAGLTAILLLVDDYMTWKEGGNSVIDWTEFDEGVKKAKEFFNTVKESITEIKTALEELFDLFNNGRNFKLFGKNAANDFTDRVFGSGEYKDSGMTFWERMLSFFSGENLDSLVPSSWGSGSVGAFGGSTVSNDINITVDARGKDADDVADAISDRITTLFRSSNLWS